MKKYLWILGVLFFGGLAGFALFATDSFKRTERKSYEPAPLTFVIDWEISKPVVLQVIYLKDKNDVFSQRRSVWKHVNPEDKHVELVIPAKRIYNFRVDFKSKPGKIVIKNIEIKGDMYLNFNHWEDYRYANMDKTKINDDNYLEIYSEQDDPHMVFLYPFVLDEKKPTSEQNMMKFNEKKTAQHSQKLNHSRQQAKPDKRKAEKNENTKSGKAVATTEEKQSVLSDNKSTTDDKKTVINEKDYDEDSAKHDNDIISNPNIKLIMPVERKPIRTTKKQISSKRNSIRKRRR
ncbi:MAG: hypothetical protein IJ677_03280 [Alphaproteobacteria bacterium]|nr:hypothetical protein [Alphaproteobacteria bacterium]